MIDLREDVRIITLYGELTGYLFVGADGLPELSVMERNIYGAVLTPRQYQPATLPHTWRLALPPGQIFAGLLLTTWENVRCMQRMIAAAQREVESETPEPEDEHAGT